MTRRDPAERLLACGQAVGDEAETPVAGTYRTVFTEDAAEQLPVAAVGREVPVAMASNVRVAGRVALCACPGSDRLFVLLPKCAS